MAPCPIARPHCTLVIFLLNHQICNNHHLPGVHTETGAANRGRSHNRLPPQGVEALIRKHGSKPWQVRRRGNGTDRFRELHHHAPPRYKQTSLNDASVDAGACYRYPSQRVATKSISLVGKKPQQTCSSIKLQLLTLIHSPSNPNNYNLAPSLSSLLDISFDRSFNQSLSLLVSLSSHFSSVVEIAINRISKKRRASERYRALSIWRSSDHHRLRRGVIGKPS
ncbi:hypothetical protein RIF29_17861 [Crotalaria pallida]|uniref:Uncharacterized protein n=1 Tax=Crotalaria pallida TaxID=3830 RepID=A0AAN9IKJ6_CROPI